VTVAVVIWWCVLLTVVFMGCLLAQLVECQAAGNAGCTGGMGRCHWWCIGAWPLNRKRKILQARGGDRSDCPDAQSAA
jgi:hypothetical protein